jgi:phosphoglycerate dehydrogenase-like enzyme
MSNRESADRFRVLIAYPSIDPSWAAPRIEAVDPSVVVDVCDYLEDKQRRIEREADPDAEYLRTLAPSLSDAQTHALATADAMLALDVPINLGSVAPRLRWVQSVGSGVANYVSARLPESGITLTNAAGIGAPVIAEFVLARLLEHWKRLPDYAALQERRVWEFTFGRQVAGRVVLVVGLGAIGGEVARLCGLLGMRVIGIRRTWSPGDGDPRVTELLGPDSLDDALGRADAVVLAASGTTANQDMFDARRFQSMRSDALFVNVSRGMLVDEEALAAALRSGVIAAAALDVTREEPIPANSPLWGVPNLRLSPHSSTAQEGYWEGLVELFSDNLRRLFDGQPMRNHIDPSSLTAPGAPAR